MSTRRLPVERKDGRECVHVQIGKDGVLGVSVCYKESWELFLAKKYPPTTRFSLIRGAVYFSDGKKRRSLARVFLQAKNDQEVIHRNGDKLDLRLSNLDMRPRRGKATALPRAKESPAREDGRIHPDMIVGDLADGDFPRGMIAPEKLIRSGRKVQRANRDWFDQPDPMKEMRKLHKKMLERRGLLLPTYGKSFPRHKAPALNPPVCRWPTPRQKGGR